MRFDIAAAASALLLAALTPECRAFVVSQGGAGVGLGLRRTLPSRGGAGLGLGRQQTAARVRGGGCRMLRAGGDELLDGRVLYPGSEGDGWWDQKMTAMPVVLPPDAAAGRPMWLMYYYGREGGTWNKGTTAFLPTGVTGLAESDDGLSWTRVKGPLAGGAVMLPSDEAGALDEIQIGVTDILPKDGGGYVMHYLGGSAEGIQLSTAPGMGPLVGFRMRSLAAESTDGLTWERRAAPVVDVGPAGEWDSQFASWPRALPVDPSDPDGEWLLTYHALQPSEVDGGKWAAGAAVTDR